MKRYSLQIVALLIISILLIHSNNSNIRAFENFEPIRPERPAIFSADSIWVDSVLHSLSIEEKIAQLIMVDGYSSPDQKNEENLVRIIKKFNVGGVVFFKGSPTVQAKITNRLQQEAKTPLLIAMDAEWGLSMRLDSTIAYPRQLMLGAIQDESLIYQMGYDIGRQLKRIGVHVSFSPVADINNNSQNPVINSRSFGEDRMNVSRKAWLYAQGLEDAGVLAVFKHFPGHGDTNDDSHYTLPTIQHDLARLDSLELFPFRYGIERGISAIMSAHLHVPALDSTRGIPCSLSEKVINGILRTDLGFEGIVFTDALIMKGVSSGFRPGELEARAILAGNDILLMPSDVQHAVNYIHREIRKGNLTEAELDNRLRRVLYAKAWAGLKKTVDIEIPFLVEELNDPFYLVERSRLIRNSITLLSNNGGVIPFKYPESYRVVSLAIGTGTPDLFSLTLKNYTEVNNFYLEKSIPQTVSDTIYSKLSNYNTLIVSIQETSQYPGRNYGIHPETVNFIKKLQFNGNLVLVYFGNPYGLEKLGDLGKFNSVVLTYEDSDPVRFLAAQGIFGAFELNGRLPVTVSPSLPLFKGLQSESIERLGYGFPEEEGMNSQKLSGIDSIVNAAIEMKAIPGCQVLVARNGKVILNKGYGWHSYDRRQAVNEMDLYDIASLTKISATIPCLMKLEGEGRFLAEDSLGTYINFPDGCNKGALINADILAHQSGLTGWIPFYYSTLQPIDTSQKLFDTKYSEIYALKMGDKAFANRNLVYKEGIYSDHFSTEYPVQVAGRLFIQKAFRDSIYTMIENSELQAPVYRYSDLGYYFFQRIIESVTDTLLYPYVYYNFYSRLGATRLGYLPLNRFSKEEIAPTENDIVFRKQVLRGFVHDPGAAMLGGVAGHAGLFSNANDLAKLLQMYLNGGEYGGRFYIRPDVIRKYTTRVYSSNGNRRALGFDKPEPDKKRINPASDYASLSSYGHSGFTGTFAWVDPDYNLLYIFLSNRVHPDQYNNKLITENIRTKVQDIVYSSILR